VSGVPGIIAAGLKAAAREGQVRSVQFIGAQMGFLEQIPCDLRQTVDEFGTEFDRNRGDGVGYLDTVGENAPAGPVACLDDGNTPPRGGEGSRRGQTCGTGAHNQDFVAVHRRHGNNKNAALCLTAYRLSIVLGFSPCLMENSMAGKVWFITGTSKGFGRVWAEAALARGDQVAATARNVKVLAPLIERYGKQVAAITLDVTNKAEVEAAIAAAHARFGRLDVVINNAGYGLFGAIEEVSEKEARDQIETNLFGALWVTQAALPIMRSQGSGHIIQVSSIGGVNAFPTIGLYHASKWGLEGFSQALAREVAPFGIKVTIVEPGGYATDWGGPSAIRAEPALPF
jgi:NAD(P)-dependent dehydrogenase (short-subunit alcohol dehydrogenase family)